MVYRKLPKVVECFRLGYDEIPRWMQEQIRANNVSNIDAFLENVNETVKIKTLEGVMNAVQGDYIIRGVKGEIYPCKPEIFKETYEYVPLRHIVEGDELAGVTIYLDEANYLGEDAGDIIVFDETHKIISTANEDGTVKKIYLYDKNGVEANTIVLYEDGERKLNKVIIPETFTTVTKIDDKKVAYEFLRIEREDEEVSEEEPSEDLGEEKE
jgi:hypothetical protein